MICESMKLNTQNSFHLPGLPLQTAAEVLSLTSCVRTREFGKYASLRRCAANTKTPYQSYKPMFALRMRNLNMQHELAAVQKRFQGNLPMAPHPPSTTNSQKKKHGPQASTRGQPWPLGSPSKVCPGPWIKASQVFHAMMV